MHLTGDLIIGAADVAATEGVIRAVDPATNQLIGPDFAQGGAGEVDRAARLADGQ
jgi:NADP-dependent aldehyde dehydrogenase